MSSYTSQVTILLVEDEAILALDLRELLEAEGYAVVGTAATGPRALELFRQHPVDIVLCDIRLQGPWDGIATASRLLAERAVPLIYLTALTDRATLDRALATTPAAYLAKPVNVPNLRAAIELALLSFKAGKTEAPAPPTPAERPPDAFQRETILRLDQHIFLKHNYRFVRLTLADVVLLEADNTLTTLVTTGPRYSLRLSLTSTLERLNYPALVRVHRSFAINIQRVSSFSETGASLHDLTVPLGRQYKADFLRHFQQQ